MKTTNYTLELLISGFGATIWILLFLLMFIPFPIDEISYLISNQHSESFLLVLIFLLFPIIYIVGIVYDRFVDIYMDKWFYYKYRAAYFKKPDDLIYARSFIYLKSEPIKNLFEYSKIRIRILRTWVFSSFLIAIFLPFAVVKQFSYFNIVFSYKSIFLLTISVMFFAINTIVTFKAWKNLAKRECYLLKTQSEILESKKHSPQ